MKHLCRVVACNSTCNCSPGVHSGLSHELTSRHPIIHEEKTYTGILLGGTLDQILLTICFGIIVWIRIFCRLPQFQLRNTSSVCFVCSLVRTFPSRTWGTACGSLDSRLLNSHTNLCRRPRDTLLHRTVLSLCMRLSCKREKSHLSQAHCFLSLRNFLWPFGGA